MPREVKFSAIAREFRGNGNRNPDQTFKPIPIQNYLSPLPPQAQAYTIYNHAAVCSNLLIPISFYFQAGCLLSFL
jgi:hypothetical protein